MTCLGNYWHVLLNTDKNAEDKARYLRWLVDPGGRAV